MRKCYLLVMFISLLLGCKKKAEELPEAISYANPLLQVGPDPWVVQKDSFYYYTNTTADRLELWKTKALSRLANAQKKLIWKSSGSGAHSHNIWAPELHRLDGKWYFYFSAGSTPLISDHQIYVLENDAEDPFEGSWVDKGKICDPLHDYFSIDATVLQLNNKKYLIWSSVPVENSGVQALYIAEMKNPWTLASSRVLISSPAYDWEKVGSAPDHGVNEGPEVLKNSKGQVFLTYSASGCWTDGYGLGLLTLKDEGDPLVASNWSKSANSYFQTSSENKTYGPGHNSFFKSPDSREDWILYHAHTDPGQSCDDYRNPRIQKFTWNSDGSPNFGLPVHTNRRLYRPSGEQD